MMNVVVVSGRLVDDPDFRTTQNGKPVANFRIAVQRYGKTEPDFLDCVAWSAAAEIMRKYTAKGDKIGLTGHIQTRQYQDRDGNKRKVWEIIAESIDLPEKSRIVADPEAEEPAEDGSDLPF